MRKSLNSPVYVEECNVDGEKPQFGVFFKVKFIFEG